MEFVCRKCKILLPDYCFNKDNLKKTGYSNRCKNCLKIYRVELKKLHNNVEVVVEQNFSVTFN